MFIFLHLRSSVFPRLVTAVWVAASIGLTSVVHAQPGSQGNPPVYAPPAAYGQFVNGDSLAPSPLPPITGSGYSSAPSLSMADSGRTPAKLASYPRDVTEPLLDQPDNFVLIPEAEQPKSPPTRGGLFQRIAGTTTYLPRFGNDSVGFEDTEVYGVFAVPCPTREMPLLIEPGTDFWVVDAPGFNLPSTLHDDYLEFHWLAKLTDVWAADVMITPGWHSDYHNPNGSQAFRLESHAVIAYNWSPNLKIAVGAAYWGRLNANIVPAGGIIWTPNEYTRYELITPKPRIAFRFDRDCCSERWVYLAGEFGGGQWAIHQDSYIIPPPTPTGGITIVPARNNILDYSDYRVMLGIEHKSLNLSLNGFAEVGYVFGRQLQYETGPDQNLPSTMVARLGLSY